MDTLKPRLPSVLMAGIATKFTKLPVFLHECSPDISCLLFLTSHSHLYIYLFCSFSFCNLFFPLSFLLDLLGPQATLHLVNPPSLCHMPLHPAQLIPLPEEGHSRFLQTLLPIYSFLTVPDNYQLSFLATTALCMWTVS